MNTPKVSMLVAMAVTLTGALQLTAEANGPVGFRPLRPFNRCIIKRPCYNHHKQCHRDNGNNNDNRCKFTGLGGLGSINGNRNANGLNSANTNSMTGTNTNTNALTNNLTNNNTNTSASNSNNTNTAANANNILIGVPVLTGPDAAF